MKKIVYKTVSLLALGALSLGFPTAALAQTCNFTGIDTALGCIPANSTSSFVEFFLRWGARVGGGVALLLIAYAGITIMTASGNPQKVAAGKETMTAAIAGLFFLLFCAFILRLVGVDILGIPELARN